MNAKWQESNFHPRAIKQAGLPVGRQPGQIPYSPSPVRARTVPSPLNNGLGLFIKIKPESPKGPEPEPNYSHIVDRLFLLPNGLQV